MLPTSLLFIFVASLTAYASPSTNNIPGNVHQLLARQSLVDPNEIPPVCANRCAHAVSTSNGCAENFTPTCGCSKDDEKANADCLSCLLSSTGVPDPDTVETIQTLFNGYVDVCNAAGANLPSITLGPDSTTSSEGKNSVPVVGAAAVGIFILSGLLILT